MSPGWPYSAVLPAPCTRNSPMDSTEGNRSRLGELLRICVIEIPSTVVSIWAGSPPCTDKFSPLSACTPGSTCSIAYGLVLPAPRTLVGRFRTFSRVSVEAMAGLSVAITPAALVTSTDWVSSPTSSVASTRRRPRAATFKPLAV